MRGGALAGLIGFVGAGVVAAGVVASDDVRRRLRRAAILELTKILEPIAEKLSLITPDAKRILILLRHLLEIS